MVSPITILKNNEEIFRADSIQHAARFLAEHLRTSVNKCYDPIERGYVYHIPYKVEEDEYRFIALQEISANRRKELEERDHKNARRVWLVPANPTEFDLHRAFSQHDTLDWKRSAKYENSDLLFMYVSGKTRKVRYKVEVIEGLVRHNDTEHHHTFWIDEEKYEQSKDWEYTRIRLVDEVDTDVLSLEELRNHGLIGNIQGPMKLTGDLRDYVMSFFTHDLTEGFYPEEVSVSDGLEEGKCKTIVVNTYERNPIARKQCIEHYGVQCQICHFDFEKVYGDVGRDFIHVHHLVPLHTIKQNYMVDPVQDLIPVCPNCHTMLHRKENHVYLSVDQLRERVFKTN